MSRWLKPQELRKGMMVYGTRAEGNFGYIARSERRGWVLLEDWVQGKSLSIENRKAGMGPSRVSISSTDLVEVEAPEPWPDPAYGETSL